MDGVVCHKACDVLPLMLYCSCVRKSHTPTFDPPTDISHTGGQPAQNVDHVVARCNRSLEDLWYNGDECT